MNAQNNRIEALTASKHLLGNFRAQAYNQALTKE
jgi:hypothetical protein